MKKIDNELNWALYYRLGNVLNRELDNGLYQESYNELNSEFYELSSILTDNLETL
jgi:hypothetical protein